MKKIYLLATLCALFLISCEPEDGVSPNPEPINPEASKALILSEGGTESYLGSYDIDAGTITGNYFGAQNGGAALGNLANDILQYGSKIYIVLNVSNNVTVINAADGKLVKRIVFSDDAKGKGPRYAITHAGKVYVSCQNNKVAIIDTLTQNITVSIAVGSNPEQMAIANGKLFVANSGGFNYPKVDSTVSIINLSTNMEIQKVDVGYNPAFVKADENGNVYIGAYGIFGEVASTLVKVNSSTHALEKTIEAPAGRMAVYGGKVYITPGYGTEGKLPVYNGTDLSVSAANFVTDGTAIQTPYGITIDPKNGNVWAADAVDYRTAGKIFLFGKDGKKITEFSTSPGVNPNSVVLLR